MATTSNAHIQCYCLLDLAMIVKFSPGMPSLLLAYQFFTGLTLGEYLKQQFHQNAESSELQLSIAYFVQNLALAVAQEQDFKHGAHLQSYVLLADSMCGSAHNQVRVLGVQTLPFLFEFVQYSDQSYLLDKLVANLE